MTIFFIVTILALICGLIVVWNKYKEQREITDNLDIGLLTNINRSELDLQALHRILRTSVGGAVKRVSEIHEITETILAHAPELFEKDDGLIYWLEAQDEFLHALIAKMPKDSFIDHELERLAEFRQAKSFAAVHARTGKPVPHSRIKGTAALLG